MFEFDEHYTELEAMEAAQDLGESDDNDVLPAWAYVGHDVWKLDFDLAATMSAQEWCLESEEVA